MKNYIEGLKEIKGGGNIQEAQNTLKKYESIIKFYQLETIEDVTKFAEYRLKFIFIKFNKDIKKLQLKSTEQQNKYYERYYMERFKFYEYLLDACYCIEWTKKHQ